MSVGWYLVLLGVTASLSAAGGFLLAACLFVGKGAVSSERMSAGTVGRASDRRGAASMPQERPDFPSC